MKEDDTKINKTMKPVNDRVILKNLNSTLKYYNFEEMNNQQIVDKYEETLWHREQQIKQLSNAIGILNEKIVHAADVNKRLFEEIDKLKKDNEMKNIVLIKELKNKEMMFEQINSIVAENNRIKKSIKTYEMIIQVQNDQKEKDNKRYKETEKKKNDEMIVNKESSDKNERVLKNNKHHMGEVVEEIIQNKVLSEEENNTKEEMKMIAKVDGNESGLSDDYNHEDKEKIENVQLEQFDKNIIEIKKNDEEVYVEDCIDKGIKPQLQLTIEEKEPLIETIIGQENIDYNKSKYDEPVMNDQVPERYYELGTIIENIEINYDHNAPQYNYQQKIDEQEPIRNAEIPLLYSNQSVIDKEEPKTVSKQPHKISQDLINEIEPRIIEEILIITPYQAEFIEEPKLEESKLEEPKLEEPKLEEPKLEEPKLEEPKLEEPKLEEPKLEEPKLEEPKLEEPKLEEPSAEEIRIEELNVEEPIIKGKEDNNKEIISEGTNIEDIKREDTKIKELLSTEAIKEINNENINQEEEVKAISSNAELSQNKAKELQLIITSANQLFSRSPDKTKVSQSIKKEEQKEEDIQSIIASTNQLFNLKQTDISSSIIPITKDNTQELKEQPEAQVDSLNDKKAKKKKRKPKPKPVTIQPLGSDTITYDPFFK